MLLRSKRQRAYPLHVELAAAAVILWRELSRLLPGPLSRRVGRPRRNRLIPLTSPRKAGQRHAASAAGEHPEFWNELVTAAEASSAQALANAKPVRRLVRFDAGEIVEMKLAHRRDKTEAAAPDDGVTAFFRFQDAVGPLGFAAIEQYGRDGLLRSVLLLEHRRGSGVGSEMVSQVMEAATALGIKKLWLLTETADSFFAKRGFRRANRSTAPAAILGSAEFKTTPASAICMATTLPQH